MYFAINSINVITIIVFFQTGKWKSVCSFLFNSKTLFSDMMFVLHSSYRLFCCRLHHVGSACGWTRPDYCDYCSSHQSSRWENSHQHLFGLMNTKCQFTAEMLLCALFPREPESAWWRHCELKICCPVSKYHLGVWGPFFDSIFVLLYTGASWWRRRLSELWQCWWPLCLCLHRSTTSTSTQNK